MTLIDQRILIPAPAQIVWQVVSDHRQLHLWRTDVRSVSLLSTTPHSPGARRRISPQGSHKDIIEEVTIWYEGIGYEYRLIEGGAFRSYVSRIRLQSTPDGTIVQWTISYELGNIFKRLLRGRYYKRLLTRTTTESLRQLLRHIHSLGITLDQQYRDRTSIKEAPDVETRADYGTKRLAQQQTREQPPATTEDSSPIIEEPPARIEDTPSVPRVGPPSFLADALTEIAPDDTQPNEPVQPAPEPAAETSQDPMADTKPKRPAGLDEAIAAMNQPSSASEQTEHEERDPTPTNRPADLPPPTGKRDTGEMSIWDVFGVERPKDTLTSIIDELRTDEETDQEKPSLDDWLAANEPPVSSGSSSTVRTIARAPRRTPHSLQRRHLRQRLRIRPPRR